MTIVRFVLGFLLLGAVSAHMAGAQDNGLGQSALEEQPPIIPVQAFASISQMSDTKLSPDGNRMAARLLLDGEPTIVLFDTNTMKPVSKFGTGDRVELEWFRWAGNDRILFSASKEGKFFGQDVRYTRLYVIDLTDQAMRYIGRRESVVKGDDVIHVADDGSHVLVSLQRTPYVYPSVFKFDLGEKLNMREVQNSRDGVWDWFADNAGVIRIGTGWLNGRLRIYYRSNEDGDLDKVGSFNRNDKEARYFTVSYVKAGSDQGYVLEEGDSGRVALRSFDFAKRESIETIYENGDWDVDSASFGAGGAPDYVNFTDDSEQLVWLTPEAETLQTNLEKALPQEFVRIISQSRDKSKMLIWAGGPSDPGALYLFVPGEKRLAQFAEMRPKIDLRQLSTPKPVSYTARDGVEIRAYLTLPRGRAAKDLPLIIMPHGGPYGVRDELRYDDEVQLLANRGYAVLQPNYRGSGGYGRKFSRLGRGQIGRKMQDDLDDAMDWAVEQGIADADRVCMVGGSYGGYASLWAVLRNPERYRCAASWAGVTDFKAQLRYDKNYFTRSASKRWRDRVRGQEDFNLDDVSPAEQAEKLNRPVLLAHGTDDSIVPISQFRKMRNAAKNAPVKPQLLVIKGEGHSFSTPENEQMWYDALIAFLDTHNPAE